jgi:hypothetical protein
VSQADGNEQQENCRQLQPREVSTPQKGEEIAVDTASNCVMVMMKVAVEVVVTIMMVNMSK